MLNRCEFIGRLGADPEIRQLPSGNKVANMRLAVSESWRDKASGERKEKTEWISISVFSEGLVKVVEQYLKKGAQIYVSGSWQTRKWQDQSGTDRYSTELVMQGFDAKLVMLDGKRSEDGGSASGNSGGSYGDQKSSVRDLDDPIPF